MIPFLNQSKRASLGCDLYVDPLLRALDKVDTQEET
jgi:hypothetical protein